ncbi:uncharacterized protein LOC142645826 isoform X2 [Dermatophagoides pteronyssinus]|uniref:uncharacterized protein LOC142645826 isoform X2 n=1 Tax=Dermatophagoides pteronyssinus TaxID=6956 RepID=UPI003F66A9DC
MFKLKFLLIIVAMIDDSHSYSTVRGDNQTNWYDVRYPYKAVYGLPNKLKCKQSIYERFDECEKTSHLDWQITIDEYFYETKKFCCFIWQTMNCQIDIAKQCNKDYSEKLESNTKQTYQTFCNNIGHGYKSWSCWWTENRIIIVSSVVGGALVLLTIFCIGYGLYKYNNYHKMKKYNENLNKFQSTSTPTSDPITRTRTLPRTIGSQATTKTIKRSGSLPTNAPTGKQKTQPITIPTPSNQPQTFRNESISANQSIPTPTLTPKSSQEELWDFSPVVTSPHHHRQRENFWDVSSRLTTSSHGVDNVEPPANKSSWLKDHGFHPENIRRIIIRENIPPIPEPPPLILENYEKYFINQ